MKKAFVIIICIIVFSGFGCKKYLDVNKNVDAPSHVDAYLYLANITQQYQGIYWDLRAINPIVPK